MKELAFIGVYIALGTFTYVLFLKPMLFIRFAELFGPKLDEGGIDENLKDLIYGKYIMLIAFITFTILLLYDSISL